MGCDIHLHQEVKIKGNWEHYAERYIDRNYKLFARLANVRNYDPEKKPISEPRGIPKNATKLTKFDCKRWGSDGHSHSYISAQEIHDLKSWYEKEFFQDAKPDIFWFDDMFGWLFGNSWADFIKYPKERTKGLEDIRFVFWFDN